MSLRYFANAPATTLASSCTAGATTIVVTATTGFPISYPYTLIIDRGLSTEEVVSVTAAAGTTLTVTRGYDSTTAFAHASAAPVVHGFSAIDPREANIHVNATSGVHGATGNLVGDTATQTLTNKTLGITNTINGFTASKFMEADATGKLVSGSKAIPVGVVVGDTDTQTLTNKTLTTPKIDQINNSANNAPASTHESVASGVDYVRLIGAATANPATVSVGAGGTDTNVHVNVFSKGTGSVQANGVTVADISTAQTLTNKTLSTGTKVGAATTDISAAWTAYTPTLTNVTLGTGGTVTGNYLQIGKKVDFRIVITLGTGGSFTGAINATLPVAPLSSGRMILAGGTCYNAASDFPLWTVATGQTVSFRTLPGTAGAAMVAVNATVPFTWAATHQLTALGTYEAA